MATTVLGLKTFAASDPVDYNEINDNYNKIDNGVKTALQGRAAHNLLDNSDFRNPVNQRGATSYTASSYCIDRWMLGSGSASITSSGISLAGAVFRQAVALKAGTYTFAIHLSTDTTLFIRFQYDGSSSVTSLGGESGTTGAYITMYNYDSGVVMVQFVQSNDSSGVHTATWAALYEGSYDASTLPAYQPKGYAAELAECQRYYYQSWTGSIGANGIITRQAMALPRLASVELPCTMRTTPTITLYTSNGQAGAVKGWLDSVVVSGMKVVYANSKSFIPAHEGNGLTIGNWYGFHYTASADL